MKRRRFLIVVLSRCGVGVIMEHHKILGPGSGQRDTLVDARLKFTSKATPCGQDLSLFDRDLKGPFKIALTDPPKSSFI